eukprot:m.209075 g.209075  ORF g.209075 m.209075 type:complete len:403 (+) comp25442_c0_seq3:1-1209(+)
MLFLLAVAAVGAAAVGAPAVHSQSKADAHLIRPNVPVRPAWSSASSQDSRLCRQGGRRSVQGNVTNVYDPSGIVLGDDGTPLIFSTSHSINGAINVHAASGSDLRCSSWRWAGFAFPLTQLPSWVHAKVPAAQGVWAPDLHWTNGTWHLYFALSSFGSQRSCVGHATTPRLTAESAVWTQHPPVLCSGQPDEAATGASLINAIDPHVFVDETGQPCMSVGSFFGGIAVVALDANLGATVGSLTPVAQRADPTSDPSIEASWIHYDQGWYWLYLNWGYCCRGVASTYNIRVGRSKAVTGPYLDKNSTALLDGGGTLLQATDGAVIGPGQVGLFVQVLPVTGSSTNTDTDTPPTTRTVVSEHYYNGANAGVPTLNLLTLNYVDGWPVFSPLDPSLSPDSSHSSP